MTDDDKDLLRRQDERWADPQTSERAEKRAQLAGERMNQLVPQLNRKADAMRRAPTFRPRLMWLREAAALAASAVAPHAACKAGCSHCCYQAVTMSEAEAQVIARETGAKLATPKQWRYQPGLEFSGQACPFLQAGRCSIYASRPMACRTLYNMDADALLCQLVPEATARKVPYADLRKFDNLMLQIQESDEAAARMADLRDFFPRGLTARHP